MFDRAFDYFTDVRKLEWAADSLYDWSMASHTQYGEPERMFIRNLSGLDIDKYRNERRRDIYSKLKEDYDIGSEHGASKALAMSCNDIAFIIGLHLHCYELIDHYVSEFQKIPQNSHLTGLRLHYFS